jgi:hypothetical protein
VELTTERNIVLPTARTQHLSWDELQSKEEEWWNASTVVYDNSLDEPDNNFDGVQQCCIYTGNYST